MEEKKKHNKHTDNAKEALAYRHAVDLQQDFREKHVIKILNIICIFPQCIPKVFNCEELNPKLYPCPIWVNQQSMEGETMIWIICYTDHLDLNS